MNVPVGSVLLAQRSGWRIDADCSERVPHANQFLEFADIGDPADAESGHRACSSRFGYRNFRSTQILVPEWLKRDS